MTAVQCNFCDERFDPDECRVPGAKALCDRCRELNARFGELDRDTTDCDPAARAARIAKYAARAAQKLPLFAG